MEKTFDIVLLLALPASGKSEVRKYLANLPPETLRKDFHIGETLQLDDFPYVHIMRRIDEELVKLGKNRMFFHSPDRPFQNPNDWGTLIHLINEDYDDLMAKNAAKPESSGMFLMERFDRAGEKAKIKPRLAKLDACARKTVAGNIEQESRKMLKEKHAAYPDSFEGKTIVMEFARGGPHGSSMPLKHPFGYGYSIGELSPEILKKAVVLYVWVTPEESRRKNQARTDPNDPGSILHHGVPIEVMMNDYGVDDMDWLEKDSRLKGTITVTSDSKEFNLPVARFDNRVDKTSFLRDDKDKWPQELVSQVHTGLKTALNKLCEAQ
ncbi:MAG: hypothetical protein HY746_08120 [Elusimicrobia bacterium]|nr:hypothetical protein [Elusimicrobiota bacterium]